mgnify:FL=1
MTEQELFEGFIKFFKVNPISGTRKKIVIDDGIKEEVLFETSNETILNNAGMPETVIINKPRILGDGSSITGVTKCQTCQKIVRVKSLHRCPCGNTCCVTRGCGKVWGGTWFCSLRCVILYKLRLLRRF